MKYLFIIILLFIFIGSLFISTSTTQEGFDDNRPPISKNIDAIYYINLKQRTDRKQEFLDNFSYMDESRITRVSAHYYPDNGAVGCLMSHITALNKAFQDSKGENILICEDDFYIKDMDYCNKMLDLLFQKVPEWDVVMLGQNTIDSNDTGIGTDNNEKIIRIVSSQTASGYLIKKRYIPRLLQIYENDMVKYIKTGTWGNYYTDQSWKVLQVKDRWFSFQPTVGVQRKSYSDIQKGFIGVEV
jgi:GR25 family glycosyltransferase involved in LPS biosynthesis